MKVAVNDYSKIMAVLGETPRKIHSHALFDVDQDLLIAGLIAHQQQAQTVVLEHFEGLAWNVGPWRCTTM